MDEINPVAVVGPVYGIDWFGTGPVAPIIQEHGIKVGDYLYPQQAIDTLRAEVEALRGALEQIGAIGNDVGGGDWDEIEEARGIAFRALERESPE